MDKQTEQQLAMQQQIDQFGALLRDMAPLIAGYYAALIDARIAPEEALTLTLAFQGIWFGAILAKAFAG